MLTQYINAKFPSDGKRGSMYQVFFRRVKETNKTTNLQASFFYNAVLYSLTDLPIASVLLPKIFPANERVCLNMHRLCFVDNWLLHPISENWYFTLLILHYNMFNIAGTAFPKYDYMYAWLTQLCTYVHVKVMLCIILCSKEMI